MLSVNRSTRLSTAESNAPLRLGLDKMHLVEWTRRGMPQNTCYLQNQQQMKWRVWRFANRYRSYCYAKNIGGRKPSHRLRQLKAVRISTGGPKIRCSRTPEIKLGERFGK